jgi:hypothetical protein
MPRWPLRWWIVGDEPEVIVRTPKTLSYAT